MNILLIAPAFAPVVTAHSERAVALSRVLQSLGHEVTVVTPDTFRGLAAEGYRASDFAARHNCVDTGLWAHIKQSPRLRPIRALSHLVGGFPGPYVFEARRLFKHVEWLLGGYGFDAVWVTTPPHELQLVGYWLRRRYGLPYVMDLRDPWGESTRIRWATPLHRHVARHWYSRCLSEAQAVITNSLEHFDVVSSTAPSVRAQDRLFCIPNGYFEADVQAGIRGLSFNPPGVRTITYAGSPYGGRVEEVLADLQRVARSRGWSLNVRAFGIGSPRADFEASGLLSPREVAQEVVRATYLFLYMPPEASTGPVMSLKSYLYARAGRPIVYYGPINETYRFLEAHTTVVAHRGDPDAVIDQLATLDANSTRSATALANTHSWEARAGQLEEVLRAAIRPRSGAA